MQEARDLNLFISYAEDDVAWVEGYLLDALSAAGVKYIDEAAFDLGVPRLLAFEQAIQSSERTLLVLSPAYIAENFNQFVDLLAQSYGMETAAWPVIPLILKPVALPARLSQLVALEATNPEDWEKAVTRLCEEIKVAVPGAPEIPPCPYPGMVPFSETDSGLFFGREKEIEKMLQHFRHQNLLYIIGSSGSGKSSLISAGFLPQLRQSSLYPEDYWFLKQLRPGSRPVQAVQDVFGVTGSDPKNSICEKLGTIPAKHKLLLVVDQLEEVFTQASKDQQDQFFQIIREIQAADRCALLLAMRADFYPELMESALWPIDSSHRLEITTLKGAALQDAIVQPAEKAGVYLEGELVTQLMADVADEPGVLPLLQETMVLLWATLQRRFLPFEAYQKLGDDQRTGLDVAIAAKADSVWVQLSTEQQMIARRVFLRLVQFGEGRADTRRQQSLRTLGATGDDLAKFKTTIQLLTNHRLLTLSAEESPGSRKADISHEALIQSWPKLQEWVNERREAESTRRRLEIKAEEWIRLGRGVGGLLDDYELLEAERWMDSQKTLDLGVSENLAALMQVSRDTLLAAEHREKERQQRELEQNRALARTQRQRVVIFGVGLVISVILLAISGIFWGRAENERGNAETLAAIAQNLRATAEKQGAIAQNEKANAVTQAVLASTQEWIARIEKENAVAQAVLASTQRARAETNEEIARIEIANAQAQAAIAEANRLASTALNFTDSQLDLALLLSVEAYQKYPNEQTYYALSNIWDANPKLGFYLRAQSSPSRLAWASNGQLAVAYWNGSILIWDLESRKPSPLPEMRSDSVTNLAWSPDGQRLASVGWEGKVAIWDTITGTPRDYEMPAEMPDDVRSLDWSSRDQLALGSNDGSITIWSLKDKTTRKFHGHPGYIESLVWSPDGQWLASSAGDAIIIWDPETETSRYTVNSEYGASRLAWGMELSMLAFNSSYGYVNYWWYENSKESWKLYGHSEAVSSVAWSPAGALASGSYDGTIIIWNIAQTIPGEILRNGELPVSDVVWLDESKLASAGDAVIIWDRNGMYNQVSWDQPIDFSASPNPKSPDGQWEVLRAEDDKIIIRESATGNQVHLIYPLQLLYPLSGKQINIGESYAWSPDSLSFALGLKDSVVIYRLPSGTLVDIYTYKPNWEDWGWSVTDLVWLSEGEKLAAKISSFSVERVIVFETSPAEWIRIACQRAGRNLSEQEWVKYFGKQPYHVTCPQWPVGE